MEIVILLVLAALGISGYKSQVKSRKYYSTKIKSRPFKSWTYDFESSTNEDEEWKDIREVILKRDGYKCVICGFPKNLTVHHITPKYAGGTNEHDNLQTLCAMCHENKHGRKIFVADEIFTQKQPHNRFHESKINEINLAIRSRTVLNIRYLDRDGNTTERKVEPIKIFEEQGILYVRAYCKMRNDKRTFRISRMNIY